MKNLFTRNLNNDIVVIAEVGVTHEGSYVRAKELIQAIIKTAADAIRIQHFTIEK